MTRLLILYAHPAQQFSRMNRQLSEVAQSNPAVYFNDLYHHYPTFLIDVDREQKLLLMHDIVVFQHPLYWYSTPAILKEWQDIVLQPGFAYGEGGDQLHNKRFTNAVTAGGAKSEYSLRGHNHHPILDFLLPIRQTMVTCGMRLLDPFVSYGMYYGASLEQQQAELHRFADWLDQLATSDSHPSDTEHHNHHNNNISHSQP